MARDRDEPSSAEPLLMLATLPLQFENDTLRGGRIANFPQQAYAFHRVSLGALAKHCLITIDKKL
jgi:hypothetical protein